jgi:hypothetical protein
LEQTVNETSAAGRRLICSGCGGEFGCGLSETCWCADESFRLPMPADARNVLGPDCLCPDCLRRAAASVTGSERQTG